MTPQARLVAPKVRAFLDLAAPRLRARLATDLAVRLATDLAVHLATTPA
ncbi:hypothetical protein [Roseomonas sp. CECT 9278]|nr:hypothetical protein [Roseomonas sp. CECT 9278]CAH0125567.1 hypothetical protein ROS9278_00065 [Roseomonas sp. CECT 9278]